MQPPATICVLRLSAIGDCCHTLPVVRNIQQTWPDTKITWIIGATESRLFGDIEDVEFLVFDKNRGFGAYRDIRQRLRGRHFPVLLNLHASMRAGLLSLRVPAARKIGFDRARAKDWQWLFTNERIQARSRQHVMDGLMSFLEPLGIEARAPRWDIPIPEEDRAFAAGLQGQGRPLCVISPSSSERRRNFRNWSASNYAAVAETLHRRYDARVVLTGGPSGLERRYGAEIERSADCPVTNLIGRTSLKRLLAILDCAELLICPDSGPAHMATAVGTPVVGLYATSNRFRTGPYFSQDLVVDAYPEAVQREFGKPVEALSWGKRVRDPAAMDLIRLERVLDKVAVVLGAGRAPDPATTPDKNPGTNLGTNPGTNPDTV